MILDYFFVLQIVLEINESNLPILRKMRSI